jgi:hypothetical protein
MKVLLKIEAPVHYCLCVHTNKKSSAKTCGHCPLQRTSIINREGIEFLGRFYKNLNKMCSRCNSIGHAYIYFCGSHRYSHSPSLFFIIGSKVVQQLSCIFLLDPPSKPLLLDYLKGHDYGIPHSYFKIYDFINPINHCIE